MAWQQRMEAMKATQVDRTTATAVILGIILGLVLGLLIGWVWWPVEWQGTETAERAAAGLEDTGGAGGVTSGVTASSQFTTLEARYLYLGATADAFVYAAAAGSPDAAAVAAQRLAALGGDLRSAFDDSIDFYRNQAGGSTQVSNLTTLAAAVGIPLGTSAADAGETTGGQAAQGAAAESTAGATVAAGAGAAAAEQGATAQGSGNSEWLLGLLGALVLIGGGLYMLWWLNNRRDMQPSSTGAAPFDDEDFGGATVTEVPAFDRSSLSPMRGSVTPAASMRSTVERPVAVEGRDPHGFDAEDEDAYSGTRRTVTTTVTTTSPRAASSEPGYGGYADDEDEESDEENGGNGYAELRQGAAGGMRDEEGQWIEDDETADDEAYDEDAEEAGADTAQADAVPPTRSNVPGTSVGTAPPPTLRPPTPSRYDKYATIDTYTATYYLGQIDFDQGKPIGAPDGDGYLGEYSVGIPPKNGLLDHDMMKPIAMEVVLFDKTDGRSTLTTTRLLLSEYAHDHQYEEYQRANPNLAPIVAAPNTNFQLEGKQLLLDCLIREVRYTREGFFQNVVLDLVVKRKV